jgi:hypothetical protein
MPLGTRGQPDDGPDLSVFSDLLVDTSRIDGPPCNDIPDYRDPYPDECKPLLYEETFATDPGKNGRWEFVNPASWTWSQGKLTQMSTAQNTEWAVAKINPPLTTASYLVEAEVTLGPKSAAEDWSVGIAARVTRPSSGDLHYILGELWQDPTKSYNPSIHPTMRLLLKNSVTDNDSDPEVRKQGMDGWPDPNTDKGVEGKVSETYYLQLWHTPNLKKPFPNASDCHNPTPACPAVLSFLAGKTKWLIDGWFDQTKMLPIDQYLTKQVGTVGLRTLNRSATYHYVRVYGLKNP